MPAPRYITADSQIGAEGLYLQEVSPPGVTQGETLNTVGIVGQCVKGPVGTIVECTSAARFLEVFGGRDGGGGGAVEGEIWKSLVGRKFGPIKALRVAAAAATTAEADFDDSATPVINIAASSPGDWGNDIAVTISDASDGDEDHFNLRATWNGRSKVFENLDVSAGNDNLSTVIGDDYGTLITATKLDDGRPDNAADQSLDDTTAADGTLADSDYTTSALDAMDAESDVGVAFVAGNSNSTIKAAIVTLAAASNDTLWLITADASTTSAATAATEADGLTPSDRWIYCFNHVDTIDPLTATTMVVEPHGLMASILSQTDADVHPGDPDNRSFAAAVQGLALSLTDGDYDSLLDSNICALEKHRKGGYVFVSGVNGSDTTTEKQITRRRMADYVISGARDRAEADVKKPNTLRRRQARSGSVLGWLRGLARQGRYVDVSDSGSPLCAYDTESLNTADGRAAGIQKDLMRVKLIGFSNFLVLASEIGTTVKITETA